MVAVADRRLSDEGLVERAVSGDEDAFAALYERYFDRVYDFVLRIVRDRDAAADVVEGTFVKAWRTRRDRPAMSVKAWLYTLAHNASLRELRRRKRLVAERDEHLDEGFALYTQVDTSRVSDPETVLRDRELVSLVWASAAALSPKDYALLDLHLRQDLSADELATGLGLEQGEVSTRLRRLRGSLEEAVATVVLIRRGRRDCPELGRLLVGAEASKPSAELRQAVRGHQNECRRCQESKRRLVSPLQILGGLASVRVSPQVRDEIWERISDRIRTRARGRPPRVGRGVPHLVALGVAAVVVATASAGGAYLALRGDSLEDPSDVESYTHDVGRETSDWEIGIRWTRRSDVLGYSIEWSREPQLPDETRDLPGEADGAAFTAPPGRWWFNLRTQGRDGSWTSTVQLGPFVILARPRTEIVEHPEQPSNDPTPDFAFAAEEVGGFECSLDGKPFERCAEDITVPRLNDGRHVLAVRARDRFGNADTTPARFVWWIDTRPPQARIRSANVDGDDASFTFRSSGGGAVFECRLDDREFRRCRSSVTYRNLEDGTHEVRVRATDRAGNTGPPARSSFAVDTIPPDTTIVAGPEGRVASALAAFEFSASEAGSSFECSLDGRAFVPCSSPIAYTGLTPGAHEFQVRARDEAGNVDASPAVRAWTVRRDNAAPNTNITSGPPPVTEASSATFAFGSEPAATFECRLDGGAWASCSSPTTYTGLGLGAHSFAVRAVDAAGNRDPTPATWYWKRRGRR
jgi:RNA polymerase sigma factor (sigma-70 family)